VSKQSTPIAPPDSADHHKGNARKSRSRKRQHIQPGSQGPFSDGVLVGNTLYLAGRIGVDNSRIHVPDDIETEARNVANGVEKVLQKAGMQMDDLVYVQVFCPDVALGSRFNKIFHIFQE
jgi:2-iminobutanoate/2-iminopropanoate deaminase